MLERTADPRLAVFVAWLPKVGAEEGNVAEATRVVPDRRARHYWDGTGALMRAFRPPLGLDQDAWDLYLLYGPEARWEGATPPRPAFWMHQLMGVSHAPEFDPGTFAERTRALLRR